MQDHPAYVVDLSEVHFGGKTRVTIGNFEEFVSQQKNAVYSGGEGGIRSLPTPLESVTY